MKKIVLIAIILSIGHQNLFAQETLPIIDATSKSIKILDGDDLQDGVLVPELRPDIYIYHKINKPKKIVYYTNIDSISFQIKPGDTYHFAILLNNKDTCYQKITSENPGKVIYSKHADTKSFPDTIPFILGANIMEVWNCVITKEAPITPIASRNNKKVV